MKNNILKKYINKNRMICLFLLIYILILIAPTIISSAFTVFSADDFSAAMLFGNGDYGWNYIKNTYMKWQGTYTGLTIIGFLSPIKNFNLTWLRLFMVGSSIMLFMGIISFVHALLKLIIIVDNVIMRSIIISLVVYAFVSYCSYNEIFYWFTGAAVYTIPFAFSLISLALFIYKHNDNRWCIPIMITGFIGNGGALVITGMSCYLLLCIIVYYGLTEKKINRWHVAVFGIWLVGALINTLAPGNYVRYSVVDTKLHEGLVIIKTIKLVLERVDWLFKGTNFLGVFFVIIGICIVWANRAQAKCSRSYIVFSLMLFATPFVTIFPSALGEGEYLPLRVACVLDLSIVVTIVNTCVILSMIINEHIKALEIINMATIIIVFIAFACCIQSSFSGEDSIWRQTIHSLKDNEYQSYYSATLNIYAYLESEMNSGKNVELSRGELPLTVNNYFGFLMSEDETYYANTAVAYYYGLSSIKIVE